LPAFSTQSRYSFTPQASTSSATSTCSVYRLTKYRSTFELSGSSISLSSLWAEKKSVCTEYWSWACPCSA